MLIKLRLLRFGRDYRGFLELEILQRHAHCFSPTFFLVLITCHLWNKKTENSVCKRQRDCENSPKILVMSWCFFLALFEKSEKWPTFEETQKSGSF